LAIPTKDLDEVGLRDYLRQIVEALVQFVREFSNFGVDPISELHHFVLFVEEANGRAD
jgi:hypothetical protein